MRRSQLRFPLAFAALVLLALATPARADVVDYSAQGSFMTSDPLPINGLTATPGAGQTLSVTGGRGLGVVGGTVLLGHTIDVNESVLFEFDAGSATGVFFSASEGFNSTVDGAYQLLNLEGFGVGGTSLGIVQFEEIAAVSSGFGLNVSAAFGNVPLSGFRIAGNGPVVGLTLWKVFFTPVTLDITAPTLTVSADKTVLWPPSSKLVPVRITGQITDEADGSGVAPTSVAFRVTDEYGQVQPTGGVTLAADGSYAFTVWLQASRRDTDRNGRTYTATVSTADNAGNAASESVQVVVPHDKRR